MYKRPSYKMIHSKSALKRALRQFKNTEAGLDFETTTLTPDTGEARLVSLSNRKHNYLVDFFSIKGGFKAVAPMFAEQGTRWIVFNHGFEMRWFKYNGATPILYDVQNLRRAILGGSSLSLKLMLEWDLGRDISKEEQASNWGAKKLTKSQLNYAMDDAVHTFDLWEYWSARADEGQNRAFRMLNDLELPVMEMEDSGMLLDQPRHAELIKDWTKIRDRKIEIIRELVSEDEVANLNSDKQWSMYFSKSLPDSFLQGWPRTEKSGDLSMKSDNLRNLAGAVVAQTGDNNPLSLCFDTLADYKRVSKYLSSFGETLLTSANLGADKRIHARFNIAAAKTCRFSCSGPNLQQVPRDQDDFFGDPLSIRTSFRAARGRTLVSLDYSGIELRVLALLSEDDQLLHDVVYGDVHSEVAAVMAGRKIDKTVPADKEIRSSAKRVSFGIIYGSGATGLSTTLRTTQSKAAAYIDFWESRYPRAFRLRHDKMEEATETRYIRMVDGGTVYMGKKPTLPRCANYPVQRAALSIMARAIRRHWETLEYERACNRQRHTQMLSTIHDALIDEASRRDSKKCLSLMETDMVEGYLDIFPGAPIDNLVEGGVGDNWGNLD